MGHHGELSGEEKSGDSFVGRQRELDCAKDPGDEVAMLPLITKMENKASGWAMKLRDGRKLTMPSFPPVFLSANPFYALSSENIGMERSLATVSVSEAWTEKGSMLARHLSLW